VDSETILDLIKKELDTFKETYPNNEPAIIMGNSTYKVFLEESQRRLMSDDINVAHEPITNYLDCKIYVVDRDSYLNILKESDVVG
jgi:dihydrofolate reductase